MTSFTRVVLKGLLLALFGYAIFFSLLAVAYLVLYAVGVVL